MEKIKTAEDTKLKKLLTEEVNKFTGNIEVHSHLFVERLVNISINYAEQFKPKWISADNLPKPKSFVLVKLKYTYKVLCPYAIFQYLGKNKWSDGKNIVNENYSKIIGWKPLS